MALRYPLDSVTFTQQFGANASYYKQFGQSGHNGYDLRAPAGTPIYAADDGVVAFEGWGQNHSWMGKIAGICVIIKHAGCHTGYAHMTRTVINKGQSVKKGDLIGYSGATGTATAAHLHFEVLPLSPNFKNGFAGRTNPAPYISTVKVATVDEIKQAYRDILEREADAGGIKTYSVHPIDFVRQDLARSQEKRDLDARKAEAARIAAIAAQAAAAKKAEEAAKAAAAQKALDEAKKAEDARLAAEAELARIAAEEKKAREEAEARAKAQAEIEAKAKEDAMATIAETVDQINEQTQEVLNANEFTPVISDKVKTIAYFTTDLAAIISGVVFTILAILGMMDAVIALTINTAITGGLIAAKQTFRLSAKKQ